MNDVLYAFLQQLADLCGYDLKEKSAVRTWSDLWWFQFPLINNLAAGATAAAVTIQIPNEADFEWLSSSYHFTVANAQANQSTFQVPNVSCVITDTGSGKQLMNDQVPVPAIFGNPAFGPIKLPQPKILERNTLLSLVATNFDAATATGNLRLTLHGRRLYTGGVDASE